MQREQETILIDVLAIMLTVMAGFLRVFAQRDNHFAYNGLIFMLFTAAALIWGFQVNKRLVQNDVRRYLAIAVVLMIFWMAIRTLKYVVLPAECIAARYVWYFYYLPMLFIPLLMFWSVLYIGKLPEEVVSRRWQWLFIPTALCFLGIITNDLHQMAFRFDGGLAFWSDHIFERGWIYYTVIGWIGLECGAVLAVVGKRCMVPERRKSIWIPLMPLLLGAVYIIFIIFDRDNLLLRMFRAPEIGCIVFAASMECLIGMHLFPTNDNYGAFWNASAIRAGIMDKRGVIRYNSEKSTEVTLEQVQQAQDGAVLLADGQIRLNSHAVRGGYGYWLRDISEINRLNEQLDDLGNVTADENSMLAAENKLRTERARIEAQNKLYDDMARSVKKQLYMLNDILEDPPKEEKAFAQTMNYASVLNVYVKRHSNFYLMAARKLRLYSDELYHAMAESLEYVRDYGVKAQSSAVGNVPLEAPTALWLYEIFEIILESAIPGASAMIVYLVADKTELRLQMELQAPREYLQAADLQAKAAAAGGTAEIEREDETEYVIVAVPVGGERR